MEYLRRNRSSLEEFFEKATMESFPWLILLFQICWMLSPVLGSNAVMTHTSMDVGNIISIIIPESPDTNINVDQLTADFKRQLERIRKQSRVTKLEHGLVTLKNILPEMSKEEKKKTLPLIRRVLQTRRVAPAKNSTRESSQKKNQKNKATRRTPLGKTTAKGKNSRGNKPEPKKNGKQMMKKQKVKKNPKVYNTEDLKRDEETNENGYDKGYFFIKDYGEAKWKDDAEPKRRIAEVNQADRRDGLSAVDFDKNENSGDKSWERYDINRPNRRAPAQFPCSEGAQDDEYKVRNTKGIRSFDIPNGFKNNAIKMDSVRSYPMDAGDIIDYDEMKGYEKILQSTPEQPQQLLNLTEQNSLIKRKTDEPNKSPEFNERDQISVVNIPFSGNLEAIPKTGRQFVNINDQKIEIRVQRSVDDNFLARTMVKPHSHPTTNGKKVKQKKTMAPSMRLKKPWKSHRRPFKGKYIDNKFL